MGCQNESIQSLDLYDHPAPTCSDCLRRDLDFDDRPYKGLGFRVDYYSGLLDAANPRLKPCALPMQISARPELQGTLRVHPVGRLGFRV